MKKLLFCLVIILIAGCSRNPVTGKREVMLMSKSQEIKLGAQSDPAIVAQFGLYEDQKIQDFIQRKGEAMGKISHMPDLKYHFKILDSPVVNAFALPGGYVYFTRGIMAHFNNEAQFAGVLGHEIGHVTARHSAKQYTKQMVAQVGFMAGVIASEKFRQFADQASQGLGLLFLKFGRDAESQSDELGVEYSTKIKYDAHQMADFFETLDRLQKASGQSIPDFLSTHPNPANRHAKVHEHADAAQEGRKASHLKINREQYLKMIDGMVYGEDPRQGFVENNKFYHPELKFEFPVPNNWQLANSPAQVQMAPKDGQALMVFTLSQEASLDATAQKIVQENQFKVIESRKSRVNGLQVVDMLSQQSQQDPSTGQTQTLKIATRLIQYGKYIYVFHGVSDNATFNRYANSFRSTMDGFAKLTDPSKLNVQPQKLKIATVKANGTVKQALTQLNVKSQDLNELAILNGMQLNETIKAGSLLKIVVD